MQSISLGQLQFQKKSKRKAGDGNSSGTFRFFTSSQQQSKWVEEADFIGPALIFGTGGSASIHYCNESFSSSTDCFVLRSDRTDLDLKYVYYFLRTNISILENGFKGAGLKHISKEYLSEINIPLPPLEEQKSIIAKLDKLTELIDLKKEAIRKTEDLTKSVFLKMFGDPIENPKGWKIEKLGKYGLLQRGRSQHRPRNAEFLFGGPYPFIQTGDVAVGSGFYINHYTQTLSEDGIKQSRLFLVGTICITIAANIGDAKILTFDSYFPDSVVGMRSENPEFLACLLTFYKDKLEQRATKTAQKNINLEVLNDLDVIYPDIESQISFSRILKDNQLIIEDQKYSLQKLQELYNTTAQDIFSF